MDTFSIPFEIDTKDTAPQVKSVTSAVNSLKSSLEAAAGPLKAMEAAFANVTRAASRTASARTADPDKQASKEAAAAQRASDKKAALDARQAALAAKADAMAQAKMAKEVARTQAAEQKKERLALASVAKIEDAKKKAADKEIQAADRVAKAKEAADKRAAERSKQMRNAPSAMKQGLAAGAGAALGVLGINGLADVMHTAMNGIEEFRHSTRELGLAFNLTDKDSKAFFTDLDQLADDSMRSSGQVLQGYRELANAGLAARDATLVLAAVGDVQARLGDQASGSFEGAIQNIVKMNEVSSRTVMGLRNSGFAVADIAKALGIKGPVKNFDELNKLVDQLGPSAQDATQGLLDLVSVKFNNGGPLGGAAKAMADASLSKQLDNLKGDIGELFSGLDLKPILGAVKSLRDQLGGDMGKKMAEGIQQFGTAMIQIIPMVVSFATTVAGVINGVSSYFRDVGAGVGAFVDMIENVKAIFTALPEIFAGYGRDIIAGFSKGFTGGITSVKDSVMGFAGTIKSAFTNPLKIRSPSRVFAEYGGHITEGLAGGISDDRGGAVDASRRLALNVAGSGAPQGGGSSGGGGGSVGAISIVVNVGDAGGGGAELGDMVAAKVRAALEQILSGAALQSGGAFA